MKVHIHNVHDAHRGFFHLKSLQLSYERFDGRMSRTVELECVERGEAVAVLLYDPVKDEVGLIRQFRVGAHLAGKSGWVTEIVAGTTDGSVDYPAVARRETEEEAGLSLLSLRPIVSYFISPSASTERIHLYLGIMPPDAHTEVEGGLEDEDEDIVFFRVSFAKAMEMIEQGEIDAATPLLALNWLAANREAVRSQSPALSHPRVSGEAIRSQSPALSRPRIKDWEKYYQDEKVDQMPWYHDALDHDLERVLEEHALAGRVWDIGTGPGTQAMALAKLGYEVVATDLSSTAVEKAQAEALRRDLVIDFRADDILNSNVPGLFDFIFDRGCFHVLDPEHRAEYAHTVHKRLKPGGWLFLKTFHVKETSEGGPHRLSPEEIESAFQGLFDIKEMRESHFKGTRGEPIALFNELKLVSPS